VVDCLGSTTDLPYPQAAGAISFGTPDGIDPCFETGQEPTPLQQALPRAPQGTQLAYAKLDSDINTFPAIAMAVRDRTSAQYLVAIAPDGIICRAGVSQLAELAADPDVRLVATTEIPQPSGAADSVWNYIVGSPQSAGPLSDVLVAPCFPDDRIPAEESAPPLGRDFYVPAANPHIDDYIFAPQYHRKEFQTSKFMIGDVGVSIIFPESGTCGTCDEDWQSSELSFCLAEISQGLLFLADFDPDVDLTFWLTSPFEVRSCGGMEPIRGPQSGQHAWVKYIMEDLGYDCSTFNLFPVEQCVSEYNNDRRQELKSDWYFTIFIVRDINDIDHRFESGAAVASSKYWGPYTWMTYTLGDPDGAAGTTRYLMDETVAHETCHIFGADDEYSSSDCQCGGLPIGYLRAQNLNCRNCPGGEEPCIMDLTDQGDWPHFCQHTRAQIGWRDTDGDGLMDPIDHAGDSWTLTIGQPGQLQPGDFVDIYDVAADWVHRLPVTSTNSDYGILRWDFVNHVGVAQTPGLFYVYSINGSGAYQAGPVHNDSDNPQIYEASVRPGASAGDFVFRLHFDDESAGVYVRSVVYPAGNEEAVAAYLFHDEYKNRTYQGGQPQLPAIEKEFYLQDPGLYGYEVLLSDVAGGHNTFYSGQFAREGDVTGVMAEIPKALSAGFPNPFRTRVQWTYQADNEEGVVYEVLDVAGRVVRMWRPSSPLNGSVQVVWDGLDMDGRPASSGVYFLRIKTPSHTLVRRATLIR